MASCCRIARSGLWHRLEKLVQRRFCDIILARPWLAGLSPPLCRGDLRFRHPGLWLTVEKAQAHATRPAVRHEIRVVHTVRWNQTPQIPKLQSTPSAPEQQTDPPAQKQDRAGLFSRCVLCFWCPAFHCPSQAAFCPLGALADGLGAVLGTGTDVPVTLVTKGVLNLALCTYGSLTVCTVCSSFPPIEICIRPMGAAAAVVASTASRSVVGPCMVAGLRDGSCSDVCCWVGGICVARLASKRSTLAWGRCGRI